MLSDSQTVGYQFLLDIPIYFAHRCAMNIPTFQQTGIRLGCSTCNKFSSTPQYGTNSLTHCWLFVLNSKYGVLGNGSDKITCYVHTVIFCFELFEETEIRACTHELFRK